MVTKMKKRQVVTMIAVAAIAVGTLLVGGCGSSDDKKSAADAPFIYALHADATNLDPQIGIDSQSTNVTNRKIYENLVTIDKDNNIVPMLATEWKQIDPLTMEFTLRKGVKFHDDSDFNAAAVKATFDRLMDRENPKARRTMFTPVVEVKVLSDDKVQFVMDKPFAPLLLHLAHPAASIMSPKAIEEDKAGTMALAQNPVGTGSLMLEEWIKGESVVLKQNDNYWGEKISVPQVIFKTVPEDITRMAMVKQGEAQAAEMVPVTEVARLSKDTDLNLIRTLSYRVEFLALNVLDGPTADLRVRQAISETLDFDAILKGVYLDIGQKEVSNLAPIVFGHNPNLKPYVRDVENAKRLMAEAGYSDGIKVNLITADRKIRVKLAEVIQAELKEIGINVEIRAMEFGAYIEESKKGTFNLNLTGWSNQTGDADYCYAAPYTQAGYTTGENNSRYDNPKVNALIDQARQETDSEKRKAIYGEIQEIVREDRPTLTTQVTEFIMVSEKKVDGLWMTPGGVLVLDQLKVK